MPPSTAVAEQEPFFITLGGPKAHDSSVEKHSQERAAEPQISPLHCASVGMTRGRRFRKTETVFHHLGWPQAGPEAHDRSVEKHFHKRLAVKGGVKESTRLLLVVCYVGQVWRLLLACGSLQ